MTDLPANPSTSATVTVGSAIAGSLEVAGDRDWFRIELVAGQSISVGLDGASFNGLSDPFLRLFDAGGALLFENDDGGSGLSALLSFTAAQSGTYFIEAASAVDDGAGDYLLSVQTYSPPPPGTLDQIAAQLAFGYWDGDAQRFGSTAGGSITVDLSALSQAGRTLAIEALALWSDILGIGFVEVASDGEISFGEDQEGAFADTVGTDGIITSAHVNVSAGWHATHGSGLTSFTFQTYVHEIGHALGLGHPGNYNGDARYPYDALFERDSWATSVLSGFDQHQNSYYAGLGFSRQFALTPMAADILAMAMLYGGLSTTTRAGDTVYGFNATSDRMVFDAVANPATGYTIFDSGGIDTLDFSGFASDQRIDLNEEAFSDVGGGVGNVAIARGVLIEKAVGGGGNDTIIGNAADNVLHGGAGHDAIGGGEGNDVLVGGSGYDTMYGGADDDLLYGGEGDDALDGGSGRDEVHGEAGDDIITASGNVFAFLSGGDGKDTINASDGTYRIEGDAGRDHLILNRGGSGSSLDGGAGDDRIWASGTGEIAVGGGSGDDDVTILGFSGGVIELGAGNDLLRFSAGDFTIDLTGGRNCIIVTDKADGGTMTLIGFDAGEHGDQLDLGIFGTNPFGSGALALSQQGADAHIQAAGMQFVLRGVQAVNLSTYNLGVAVPSFAPVALLLSGTGQSDELVGADGNDRIEGFGGEDLLQGGGGNDRIDGGDGSDMISGGSGADTLTGGEGADIFRDTAAGLNGDTIVDFSTQDVIHIADADIATFSFSLNGRTLNYSGGAVILQGVTGGTFVASAAADGGVELRAVTLRRAAAQSNDFDGDGRSDILWRNEAGLVSNWVGRGDGGFIINDAFGQSAQSTALSIAARGDFDGDGRADLLWRGSDGALSLWSGGPNGSWVPGPTVATVPGDWKIAGTGDFNGDGFVDLLWRSDAGLLSDWLSNGDGSFSVNDARALTSVPVTWQVAGTADFNGDGRHDILWRSAAGELSNWLGEADGSFSQNDRNAFAIVPTSWKVVGTGDFNDDGRGDILWRSTSGQLSNWLGQANGGFAANDANALTFAPTNWHIVDVGDYNGDGRDDILWRSDAGQVSNWLAQANGSFVPNDANAFSQVPTNWIVQAPESLWV